jgi:anti-anti-sigma regulatory factor
MPAEVTYENAQDVNAALISALASGIGTLVVDFTHATFCDSAGIREMMIAHRLAKANGISLQLVVPPVPSRTGIWILTGLDQVLSIYPTFAEALNPQPPAARLPARAWPPSRAARAGPLSLSAVRFAASVDATAGLAFWAGHCRPVSHPGRRFPGCRASGREAGADG